MSAPLPSATHGGGATFSVITGGEVFAPERLGRMDILIGNGQILEIGTGLVEKFKPLGIKNVVNATGKSVVPGFIDQHLHILGGGDGDGPTARVPELHLSWITGGGVTTAVGILGIDMDSKRLHALLVKANELERVGLSTYIYSGSFQLPSPYLTSSVRADVVLIDKVLGCKVALAEDTYPNLALPPLAKLAGELILAARMTGKAAVLHCHVGRNPKRMQQVFDLLDAVGMPITQIVPTHLNRRTPDSMEHAIRFAKMGGNIDFTAILSRRSGIVAGLEPDEAVARALDAGVRLDQITMSSDSNVTVPLLGCCDDVVGVQCATPSVLHREWVHIVRTNRLSLDQALPIITSNVARGLKIDHCKGSLKPGMDADIVLLDDALSVDTVMCKGKSMVSGGKTLVRAPLECIRVT